MDDEALQRGILSRFPPGTVKVELMRHDKVRSIAPGELGVFLQLLEGPEEAPAPDVSAEEVARKVVYAFHRAHADALRQLKADLSGLIGARPYRLAIYYPVEREGQTISVMTMLDWQQEAPSRQPAPTTSDEALRQAVLAQFPKDAVLEVGLKRANDSPEIEPGELVVRIVPRGPEEYNRDPRSAPEDVAEQVAYGFHEAHHDAFRRVAEALAGLTSERVPRFIIQYGQATLGVGTGLPKPPGERQLIPVMARLNPTDLETLDTLVASGLAGSRAEAVRWLLARLRERPAYRQLQERVREIEQLKRQISFE